VLGHIGINVPDLDAARRSYGAVMPLVGFEVFVDAGPASNTSPSWRGPARRWMAVHTAVTERCAITTATDPAQRNPLQQSGPAYGSGMR
jgi:hypothetical protein